jgi:hypothetical protein
MALNDCEIRIYDSDFNWLAVCGLAESVQLDRELCGAGRFEIHAQMDNSGARELCEPGNIIVINGDGRKSGIVRDFYAEGGRRGEKFVIHGETGGGMARQRIIVPPSGNQADGWDRTGNESAESVMKHYVNKHLANPDDEARKIPNLTIAEDKKRGADISWRARYTALSDELAGIGAVSGLGYEFSARTDEKRWSFEVIEGANRSNSQNEVSPVTFDIQYHNVDEYKYTENYSFFKSTGYAGGAGTDTARKIYVIGGETSGADRFEAFMDCGNISLTEELEAAARRYMADMAAVKNITVNTIPKVFIFERDYFIGDTVTVRIPRLGLVTDAKITCAREVWERGAGHKVEMVFGGRVPNLFSILQKKAFIV